MTYKDQRSRGKEPRWWSVRAEICSSILGRSLILCCILTVTLFHHSDAVVENKEHKDTRDHRVTLLQIGIVPGIVDDSKRTTLRRTLAPSPVPRATTATPITFSRVFKSTPTTPPNDRPTGKRAAARNDCCVVGQVFALTNMSCNFKRTASNGQTGSSKGSDPERRVTPVQTTSPSSWSVDVVGVRVPLVGRRIDRMLRKCLAYDDLEVHMKKCCRTEKKAEALRKCRRLINARQRRLCRMDATKKS